MTAQADRKNPTDTAGDRSGRTATTGKGMPATSPKPGAAAPGSQPDQRDASAQASLEMPSDRDQATDMTGGKQSPVVKQAGKDVQSGKQDTSKAPEMDRAYDKLK
jgi:hypothetical protein